MTIYCCFVFTSRFSAKNQQWAGNASPVWWSLKCYIISFEAITLMNTEAHLRYVQDRLERQARHKIVEANCKGWVLVKDPWFSVLISKEEPMNISLRGSAQLKAGDKDHDHSIELWRLATDIPMVCLRVFIPCFSYWHNLFSMSMGKNIINPIGTSGKAHEFGLSSCEQDHHRSLLLRTPTNRESESL